MSKRYVILYWLLVFVPTLLISASLFQLLRQEQVRIVEATYSVAQNRAQTIAETIQLTTKGVQNTITQALFLLLPDDIENQLQGFATTTGLVRDVFMWTPETGLKYPVTGEATTPEQKRFLARYRFLFAGPLPWQSAQDNASTGSPAANMPASSQQPYPAGAPAQSSWSGLTSHDPRSNPHPPGRLMGYIPWFVDNELSVLGWVQREPDAPIYGVELDLATLLSWYTFYFPTTLHKGVEYALLDSRRQILHHTGNLPEGRDVKPDLTIDLAPCLPHWYVATYIVDPMVAAKSGKSFFVLACLLLAIFVVSITLGASLLIWQAHRGITNAQKKTSFVSNVTHELKTPLTSIRMFAELLKEDRIRDPAKKAHYLQVIVGESQRLTRLVNNVLDFGRLELGQKKYHFKNLNLTQFLYTIVETQRLRVHEAGLALQNQIPEGEYTFRTDPDAIEQVLLNLIDNAIKYAAQGKELTIALEILDEHIRLEVMDRGPGVPSKHRARIFDKFHRVDNSLTSRQPGSGLGLSIAQSIMREMKGDLFYESRSGGGSIFVILIPFSSEGEQELSRKGAVSA